jgi:hypothetical protein
MLENFSNPKQGKVDESYQNHTFFSILCCSSSQHMIVALGEKGICDQDFLLYM